MSEMCECLKRFGVEAEFEFEELRVELRLELMLRFFCRRQGGGRLIR